MWKGIDSKTFRSEWTCRNLYYKLQAIKLIPLEWARRLCCAEQHARGKGDDCERTPARNTGFIVFDRWLMLNHRDERARGTGWQPSLYKVVNNDRLGLGQKSSVNGSGGLFPDAVSASCYLLRGSCTHFIIVLVALYLTCLGRILIIPRISFSPVLFGTPRQSLRIFSRASANSLYRSRESRGNSSFRCKTPLLTRCQKISLRKYVNTKALPSGDTGT